MNAQNLSAVQRAMTAAAASILVLLVLLPAYALAGTYTVKACGDGPQTDGWDAQSQPFVPAYAVCPSANANGGLIARNSGGADWAPFFSFGQTFFTSPEGTAVVRLQGDIRIDQSKGWQAGVRDISKGAWLFCGALSPCTTFGAFAAVDLTGFATRQVGLFVVCGAESCPRDQVYGYGALKNVTLTVDDRTPPSVAFGGGSLLANGWRRGVNSVRVDAADSTGIKAIRVALDGRDRAGDARQCDGYRASPCPHGGGDFQVDTRAEPDGRRRLTAQGVDAGGNVTEVTRDVLVDNHAPTRVDSLAVAAGDGWRSINRFELTWKNPSQSAAPIAAAEYELCLEGTESGSSSCQRGQRSGPGIETLRDLAVPERGAWTLRLWLRDAAGNEAIGNAERATLRFDDQPPVLAFAKLDAEDPTRVTVNAFDAPAGLGTGVVEVQRKGDASWIPLTTDVGPAGLTATLDDETLRNGTYSMRAIAADRAGNERLTTSYDDGQHAEVTLPVRVRTRLAVGQAKRVRLKRSRKGTGRRLRTRMVSRPRVRYGQSMRLIGRLTTPGQNPLPGTELTVFEQVALPGAAFRRIGTVTTSKTGRFSFKVGQGPSRVIRFRYPGTKTIVGRNGDVAIRVRAGTTIRSSRRSVVNGETTTFRGRLRGGAIPTGGKLVALQVYARGKWRTFATPRASARTGRWRYEYRFDGTRGSVRYRFRARILREATYPYSSGTSRQVRVLVRGGR